MNQKYKLLSVWALALVTAAAFAETHDPGADYQPASNEEQTVSIAVYNAQGTCSFETVSDGEIVTKKGRFALQKYFCGPGSKQSCDDHKDDKAARFAESEEKCKSLARSFKGTYKQTALDTANSSCFVTSAKYCPKND